MADSRAFYESLGRDGTGRPAVRLLVPVVLGVVFWAVVAPAGLLLRLAGRDAMARTLDRGAETYWIRRADTTSARDAMKSPY